MTDTNIKVVDYGELEKAEEAIYKIFETSDLMTTDCISLLEKVKFQLLRDWLK